MCGVVGSVEPGSAGRDQLVHDMNAAIRHRGPDDDGFYADPDVALAMRRLAIQDVAHGQQPVFDEQGTVVAMFNGELYNVAELRQMLIARGHRLANDSDSECIPHLYEEFGPRFVDKLRGMFAIALWDKRSRTLHLYRDRLGKKPLFYSHVGGRLTFASELKGLLVDPRLDREADQTAISHYLTFQYVPAPWSAVAGARKLPPGHMATFRLGALDVERYWTLDYRPASLPDDRTDETLVEEFREKLLESVRLRLVGERPLGAFLSGGLDSSAVVGAMREVGVTDLRTYSIGFEQDSHNELPFARRVAEQFETDHHEYVVKPDALSVIPKLAAMFDEPYADSSAIPSWYLADMASREVVVALNGDGGDELLGGYTRYTSYLSGRSVRVPRSATKSMRRVGQWLQAHGSVSPLVRKAGTAATLLAESDPAHRYARFLSYFRPEEKDDIFSAEMRSRVGHEDSYALVDQVWRGARDSDVVNRLLAVDTFTYLPGDLLPKVDITTMSVSLEARSPLLDHTLFEWAAGVAGHRKIVGGSGKHILKQALVGSLPDDLIHRRKKGFGVPLGEWLRGPLRELVHDTLTDATATARGHFDPLKVRTLIEQHMNGQDRSPQIYALLMLELWYREVLG